MGQDKIEEIASNRSAVAVGNSATTANRKQTYTSLYNSFRESGLSKLDSAFNALYICQTNKFCSSSVKVNNVGDGFFSHPHGWYKEKEERVRRATETKELKLLSFIAKPLAIFTKSVVPVRQGFISKRDRQERRLNKKATLAMTAAVCVICLSTAIMINSAKDTVIEVSIDGIAVAQVESADVVNSALDRVISRISTVTGESFSFPYEITYTLKNLKNSNCIDEEEIYSLLCTYTEGYTTEGYGLYIDNQLIAVLDNREDIEDVLETIKSEHMELSGKKNEDFANNIEIKFHEYCPESIITKDQLIQKFTFAETLAESEADYTRALLDAPSSMTTMSLESMTPEFKEMMEAALAENPQGAVVLDFAVYYEETVRETIPYRTSFVEDDSYYEGQEVVQNSGRNGLAYNTYKIKYVNGEIVGRELVNQNIIRNPIESVVKTGTRPLPEKMSEEDNDGKYMINPVPTAYISSRFGWRILRGKSDYHEGLDFAAYTGTPIYAAASGEVIYAGYSYSYGNHVKIRHADGLVTLYAHCSKLLVKTGDVVVQGDDIGLVGSTGDSTGYHCHLEVHVDGKRVDPENYIYTLE